MPQGWTLRRSRLGLTSVAHPASRQQFIAHTRVFGYTARLLAGVCFFIASASIVRALTAGPNVLSSRIYFCRFAHGERARLIPGELGLCYHATAILPLWSCFTSAKVQRLVSDGYEPGEGGSQAGFMPCRTSRSLISCPSTESLSDGYEPSAHRLSGRQDTRPCDVLFARSLVPQTRHLPVLLSCSPAGTPMTPFRRYISILVSETRNRASGIIFLPRVPALPGTQSAASQVPAHALTAGCPAG